MWWSRANAVDDRTLVYVEGDASLRTWENAEGQKQQALNIVQRMYSYTGNPAPTMELLN